MEALTWITLRPGGLWEVDIESCQLTPIEYMSMELQEVSRYMYIGRYHSLVNMYG